MRSVSLAFLLGALMAPRLALGQVSAFGGGGVLAPSGGLGDVARVGVLGEAGIRIGLPGSPVTVGAEAFYGRSGHRVPGEHSTLYGAAALAGVTLFTAEPCDVEVFAGVGVAVHDHGSDTYPGLNASRAGVAVTAGTRVGAVVGGLRPFVRGDYLRGLGNLDTTAFPTEALRVVLGLEIPLG